MYVIGVGAALNIDTDHSICSTIAMYLSTRRCLLSSAVSTEILIDLLFLSILGGGMDFFNLMAYLLTLILFS